MGTPAPGEVTGMLLAWRRGDQCALNRLVPLVYAELRRLAHGRMRAQPLDASLQTTGLVNEVYLKLADAGQVPWHDRVQFDEDFHAVPVASEDVFRLDDALNVLARRDPRKTKAIELRLFGELSVEEAAEALGVSCETVLRHWRMARAWLKSEVSRTVRDG